VSKGGSRLIVEEWQMTVNEPGEFASNAEVLRRILAGLQDGKAAPQVAGIVAWPVVRRGRGSRGALGGLPAPPSWAGHSVVEDGGVTHELVSVERPHLRADRMTAGAAFTCPTEVSVSVVDRPAGHRWVRLPATIQVEGGSYSLPEAARLVRAIEELLAAVG